MIATTLIDEGHRTQYGRYQAQMRRVFISYLAFAARLFLKQQHNGSFVI